MLIRKLILENVGLFRGRTEIDLSPRQKYRKTRPVVLVGGTNGAGKTTILDSIRLCLYGPLSLGDKVSQEEYHRHLRESVHRNDMALVKAQSASVALEFEFGIGGRLDVFYVERSWDCTPGSVTTALTVTRNGQPLDELEEAHADEFLRDLIPRGVSQLFFFDGEKIQEMAQASDDDATLVDSVRELLGLDMVSRLKTDLSLYTSRHRESNAPKALKKKLQKIDESIDRLQQKQLELTRLHDQSLSKESRIKEDIERIELRLSRSGGSFSDKRDSLKAELAQLTNAIAEIEKQIRDLAADLLPFTLASQLCESLRDQLLAESKLRTWHAHQKVMADQISRIRSNLRDQLFPKSESKSLSAKLKKEIEDRVSGLFDRLTTAPKDLPQTSLVHNLSDADHDTLIEGIGRVLNETPKKVRELESAYEKKSGVC